MRDALEVYIAAAREAGCPPDQIQNFLKAQVVLQPKQLIAAAAARTCDAPGGPTEVGYGGARGGGKSAWSLMQLVADDCVRVPNLKCLMLRNMQKSARESLDDLRGQHLMKIPHVYSAHKGQIVLPNGSRLISGHFSSEKDIGAYLGLEYDVIAIEEATTITFPTYRSIRTCCRTSKPNWRPRMYATTNPGGRGHGWFKQKFIEPFQARKETGTRFIPATVDDNRFLNDDYVANLETLTGWMKRAWRFGDWEIAAGQFFSNFSVRNHVVDEIDWRRAKQWFAAMDYGFNHPTVVPLGFWDGDGNAWIVEEHAERGWLVERHAEAIKAMLGRQLTIETRGQRISYGKDPEPRPLTLEDLGYFVAGGDVFAKHSTGKSVAEEYREHGIRLRPAVMDRINGAATILRLLGDPDNKEKPIPPKLFIHRRCAGIIRQLEDMIHDPDRPEDMLKVDIDADGNGGDDHVDSLRYGLMHKFQGITVQKLVGT